MSNTQKRSYFPYRRSGGKKRKSNQARRGTRKPINSPRDLLPLIQPATKALAQVVVGNTKLSGQLAHARNILEQAEQFSEEKFLNRMPPGEREDFVEQVARLKLTIADAEADFAELDAELDDESEAPPPPAPSNEKLLSVMMALSSPSAGSTTMSNGYAPAPMRKAPEPVDVDTDEDDEPQPLSAANGLPSGSNGGEPSAAADDDALAANDVADDDTGDDTDGDDEPSAAVSGDRSERLSMRRSLSGDAGGSVGPSRGRSSPRARTPTTRRPRVRAKAQVSGDSPAGDGAS